ncbi:MAG: GNAT family N-acetyltransferase [Pseudomonadota bacterium]
MAIEIKVLRCHDADVLTHVAPGVFDDPIDHVATREFLADPHYHLVVAVQGGLVVGFVSAVHYAHPDKPRPELWINEVGVATTHQGQGVGKKLIGSMLEEGRRAGCSEAWVLTDRDNTSAMRLYSASGGVEAPRDQVMFEFNLDEMADPDRADRA